MTAARRVTIVVVVGLVLVALAALFVSLSGQGSTSQAALRPTASASELRTSAESFPSPTVSDAPGENRESGDPSASGSPLEDVVADLGFPPLGDTEPVVAPPGESARAYRGLTAAIVRVEQVTTEGHGPGELSGAGVHVTVELGAGVGGLDAGAVDVLATAGAEPLSSVTTDSRQDALSGHVREGEKARGAYVFRTDHKPEDIVVAIIVPGEGTFVLQP